MNQLAIVKEFQERIKDDVRIIDEYDLSTIKLIAGLTTLSNNKEITATAIIIEHPTGKIVEQKTVTRKESMPYIPGLEAFREGPVLMEAYYELEYTPDVILIKGHGIAHPNNCGLAVYIGVETQKPTIGIALKPVTEVQGDNLVINGTILGTIVKTRPHANPLHVSTGNIISTDASKKLIEQLTKYPHKLPEPLHIAQRIAKKETEKKRENTQQDSPLLEENNECNNTL